MKTLTDLWLEGRKKSETVPAVTDTKVEASAETQEPVKKTRKKKTEKEGE